jgi:hypothetical protein
MFARREYLSGMAAVILALIDKGETEVQHEPSLFTRDSAQTLSIC